MTASIRQGNQRCELAAATGRLGQYLLSLLRLLDRLVHAEAGRLLSRREVFERLEEFPDDHLSRHQQERAVEKD